MPLSSRTADSCGGVVAVFVGDAFVGDTEALLVGDWGGWMQLCAGMHSDGCRGEDCRSCGSRGRATTQTTRDCPSRVSLAKHDQPSPALHPRTPFGNPTVERIRRWRPACDREFAPLTEAQSQAQPVAAQTGSLYDDDIAARGHERRPPPTYGARCGNLVIAGSSP